VPSASAPGKIILTGEYAVIFGWQGIAIPVPLTMSVTFEDDRSCTGIEVTWEGIRGNEHWDAYLKDILSAVEQFKGKILQGKLTIRNALPLGKGMGSSTALVIAVSRCLLGEECMEEARAIEDKMNSGHSGIDFSVIWKGVPILFQKGEEPQEIELPSDILKGAVLIDTGTPNESTVELVAQVRDDLEDYHDVLASIGACTVRLRQAAERRVTLDSSKGGSPLRAKLLQIIRAHHRAQASLGVVPQKVQELITDIEMTGGAAKVLGAGARTGGGGTVLGLHKSPEKLVELCQKHGLQCNHLNFQS